jgi:crotonobetainyl-CoA:carnitine CoA-transferase CaiB-like acyl-CoA transferase
MIRLLAGIRVVETGVLLNGGVLGALLGALGADVIKVEAPGKGDYMRDIIGTITPRNSPVHLQFNAHKRSVALDLRSEAGRAVFWRLIDTADVFVDGGLPETMNRLGLGYEAQRAVNPRIVYCHHTAFGSGGPYSPVPMHGFGMNAMAADMVVEPGPDGRLHPAPTKRPIPPRGPEATQIGSLWAAYFVAAALVRRDRSGVGELLDVSATDAIVISTGAANVMELNRERVTDWTEEPGFSEEGELTGAKYQFYSTRDGRSLLFAAMEPRFWIRFCEAIERRDLLNRGNLDSPMDWGLDDSLRTELQAVFNQRTLASWMQLAADKALPISPAYHDLDDLRDDPHMRTRDTFFEREHPDAGPMTYLGVPAKVNGQRFEVERPAPRVGQHTEAVLRELGCDDTVTAEVMARHGR